VATLVAGAIGAGLWTVGLGLRSGASTEQPEDRVLPRKQAEMRLPLTHVHLFSSGVGYFQREGMVEGDARIELTFPVKDINDLLKSMILQDLDGGRISVVGYDSQDPIDKTLGSFIINLAGNPTYFQILNQARGEKVEVVLKHSTTLTGEIVSLEKQRLALGKEGSVEAEMLNLWCAEGMRSLKLAEVERLRFLNPTVDREIKRALGVLARGHNTQKKTVTLQFAGVGKRRVRIGYVIENPIWKTSYRLMLAGSGKPALQGWAVVDNATDEDWNDVRLALVSGRPLSFQMDLHKPIYVPRPRVELELFAGLRPPTHESPMDWMAVQREALRKGHAHGTTDPNKPELPVKAQVVGEFFQYVVEHPVSLPRQKSALFPILDKQIEGKPVSIYNEHTQIKHPLLGLWLKNTTGLHLMQGPITVYADGSYAGDARILDILPGEKRLISFALDLGSEVEPQAATPSETVVAVRIDKGILYATTKVLATRTYVARNRSGQDRIMLIEHPYRSEFTLVSPAKPCERTRDIYRFELKVPGDQQAALEVIEEREVVQQVILTNADDQTVLRYISGTKVGGALKKALTRAMELKRKLEGTHREIARAERQLKAILDDQARLRANLARVPPSSEAYKRYLKKFDAQEVEIEKLQDAIKKLQATKYEQRTAYEDFLANLSVE
jgi:hypothetical protein